MDIQQLINVFELESRSLDMLLRQHPLLRPVFMRDQRGMPTTMIRQVYLRYLKMTADYVQYTVPALRAAGAVLCAGDDEDRAWGEKFSSYAVGETDEAADYGHHVWALDDMRALAAAPEMINAAPNPHAVAYRQYFVDDVARHPYAILGAKGVLEHLSIRTADDFVRGLVASGIPNIENATQFVHHHGVIDIDHVREGDHNLGRLTAPAKRRQILEAAYFTSGTYRSLVNDVLPT